MKTKTWLDELIDGYYVFLKDNTDIIENTGTEWSVISTPFIGLFNDTIELYVKKRDNKILLSDDGVTIGNLKLMGVSTSSPKRKEIIDRVLLNYGLYLNNNEICTEATEQSFAQKKFSFVSAVSEINDMYVLAAHTTRSLFKEDVQAFLIEQNIIYTPSFIARGSSGLEFNFDFQIAGHNKEIIIESFDRLYEQDFTSFVFKWEDIRSTREKITGKDLSALAFINNDDKKIQPKYLEAFINKKADFILWNERYNIENIAKLKAA
jgi:hypothetical protein